MIEDKVFAILERYTNAHLPPTIFPNFEFDPEKCVHCKLCADSCPTSCLQWDEEKRMPYATGFKGMDLACIACNNCEAVCPTKAIRMRGEYRVLYGRYKTPDDKVGEMRGPMPFGEKDIERDFGDIEKELTEVERVIYRRRSIRLFRKKPVPKELIDRIIEAARFAPSSGNGQPCKFVVVTNRDVIDKVDRQCAKLLDMIKWMYAGKDKWRDIAITLSSYFMVNEMDQRPIAAIEKVKQVGGSITWGAPVVIHVLADSRGIANPPLDTGIATQNLVLAAHSLGLGTCYIGFIASAIKFLPWLKKDLHIEYPYELVTSISVGYPRGKLDNPVARGPVPVEWIE